ncbi:hypothetical protein KUTG_10174 [Kutzneria sp. 744]|nr:hypothetical protein KUTG_10174 [Kutzneria sp. 744]
MVAVPKALAGLAAIPGVRTAAQLHPETTASTESLMVLPALTRLFPAGGLRRGCTISVAGSTSLVLALLAAATTSGSWAAVTGLPELGFAAAAELGVDLDRLALVPRPAADLVTVLSALVDGFDLVVVGPVITRGMQPQVARRMSGRVRSRGGVVITVGAWPGADLQLRVSGRRWRGVTADGYGYLRSCEVVATSRGRGGAARPVSVSLQLPGPDGVLAVAESVGARVGGGHVEVLGEWCLGAAAAGGLVFRDWPVVAAGRSQRGTTSNGPRPRVFFGETGVVGVFRRRARPPAGVRRRIAAAPKAQVAVVPGLGGAFSMILIGMRRLF